MQLSITWPQEKIELCSLDDLNVSVIFEIGYTSTRKSPLMMIYCFLYKFTNTWKVTLNATINSYNKYFKLFLKKEL